MEGGAQLGFEYLIEIETTDAERWNDLFQRLENTSPEAFSAEVVDGGVYFCDYGKSSTSNKAFRRIIDHALGSRESIRIRET